ncbi:MAG TPA: flagellar protein FliS, partial [Lacipirellulaceae bacterium]|nr:flagellar protein FliS [Lacipirellulaceae bacterium]
LRFGRQARQMWNDPAVAGEQRRLLDRMLAIVEELTRSVSGRPDPAARRLEEEYAYIYRRLAAALSGDDPAPLDEALRLIEFERDTWRLAGQQLRKAPSAVPAPKLAGDLPTSSGLSLQA